MRNGTTFCGSIERVARYLPGALGGVLTVWLLLSTGAVQAEEGVAVRRYTIVAGSNDGGVERVPLRYAETDAVKFADLMTELGGVSPADAVLLLNPDIETLEEGFRRVADKIPSAASGRTEVVFYYSGHSDEQGLRLRGDLFGYKELRAAVDALDTDVGVIVLDSCAAGALTRSKGGRHHAPFLLDEASEVQGHAFLTSSSADEVAQESERIGGSFFTHYLVTGLRGAADVSGDAKVTLSEAYQFAFDETLARTESTQGGPQHPVYEIDLTGTGDLVLTDLRSPNSTLSLDDSLGGRVSIRDAQDSMIAELAKPDGRAVSLGVPAGTYTVRIEQGGEVFEAEIALEEGGTSVLGSGDMRLRSLEQATARGDESLDDTPLAAEIVLDEESASSFEDERVTLSVNLIPGVGTSLVHGVHTVREVTINLLVGYGAAVDGVELGGILNIDTDWVDGVQVAGVGNLIGGEVDGYQLAGGFNKAVGVSGAQLSGGANLSTRELVGAQAAGGVNVSFGSVHGMQLAGGANVAAGDVSGLQLAAGANVASGSVSGAQIGAVNVAAGEVDGVMIGAVNVAEKTDFALGVVNIFWNGRTHIDVWASGAGFMSAGVKHGGDYFHYLAFAGVQPFDDAEETWSVGFGLGAHIPIVEQVYVDIDVTNQHVSSGAISDAVNEIATLRAVAGWRPTDWFALFGGLSYNAFISETGDGEGFIRFGGTTRSSDEAALLVKTFPGFLVGVSLL